MAIKTYSPMLKSKYKNKISVNIIIQLFITLISLYICNEISTDIWRSIRGH